MRKKKQNKTWIGIAAAIAGVILLCFDVSSRIHGFDRNHITAFGVTGILLILAGGILAISSRNKVIAGSDTRTRNGPPFPGPKKESVEAVIIGVTRNLRMEGAKEAYHIICRYTDPGIGVEATYTSDPLYVYPGKEIIGKKVTVYFRPSDPDYYHVDLESIRD